MSLAAVALGAKVLERHITLDKTWKGNDHESSLDPAELAELVRSVRIVERSLGNGIKRMLPCEKPCHDKVNTLTHTCSCTQGKMYIENIFAFIFTETILSVT